jgi:hypothetical protein
MAWGEVGVEKIGHEVAILDIPLSSHPLIFRRLLDKFASDL